MKQKLNMNRRADVSGREKKKVKKNFLFLEKKSITKSSRNMREKEKLKFSEKSFGSIGSEMKTRFLWKNILCWCGFAT